LPDAGNRRYGFDKSQLSALDMFKHLMEEDGLKQKDLIPGFGAKSIVSEVLSGKRAMTLEQIKTLAAYFHVAPSVFSDSSQAE
jgi:antitoxin component HigA of HigAB toxin-antitoxin module